MQLSQDQHQHRVTDEDAVVSFTQCLSQHYY